MKVTEELAATFGLEPAVAELVPAEVREPLEAEAWAAISEGTIVVVFYHGDHRFELNLKARP